MERGSPGAEATCGKVGPRGWDWRGVQPSTQRGSMRAGLGALHGAPGPLKAAARPSYDHAYDTGYWNDPDFQDLKTVKTMLDLPASD